MSFFDLASCSSPSLNSCRRENVNAHKMRESQLCATSVHKSCHVNGCELGLHPSSRPAPAALERLTLIRQWPRLLMQQLSS
jgi:hypothetical protein